MHDLTESLRLSLDFKELIFIALHLLSILRESGEILNVNARLLLMFQSLGKQILFLNAFWSHLPALVRG